jgi:hypothetical protein
MYRTNIIAWLLTLCFIALIPSVGAVQTAKPDTSRVTTSMAVLQSTALALGAPKVQGNDLYFGNTKAANVVGALVDKLGGEASILLKNGDQYVRVATTLKKEDGSSAVGTLLDANSPALAKLNSGAAYYGEATVFGESYNAGYEPIKDASGAVIGAYFVGRSAAHPSQHFAVGC